MRYLLEPEAAKLAAERGMDAAHIERLERLREVCESRHGRTRTRLSRRCCSPIEISIRRLPIPPGNALLARTISASAEPVAARPISRHTPARSREILEHRTRQGSRAIVARDGELARELYRADLAAGERWAMRVIMALPEIENINLAELTTTRSKEAAAE